MGNLLANQNSGETQKNKNVKIGAMSQHWEILERTFERQILKSKKTSLIVERYWFQMENFEDFDSQNKIFQWRNHNPNSQFMVNVLSVGKDDTASEQSTFECGSIEWCPSEKIKSKVYVVTQRILKLSEINHVLNFQKQMDQATQTNPSNILYETQQSHRKLSNHKAAQKILPFIGVNFSQTLARQLLKDWIRSIEVLCYKFGYFHISEDHLGMTVQKRGTSWISSNYAQNHLNPEDRIEVTTAEQKFKFEKQTIKKIMTLTENIPCFSNTVNLLKQKRIDRFDQFCNLLDQMSKAKKQFRKVASHQPHSNNFHNNSMAVEQGSFLMPSNMVFNNNSSFFLFDHQNALNRVNSNARINSNEKIHSGEIFFLRNNQNLLINSKKGRDVMERQTKRSNTGEKVLLNVSPESRHQMNFVNSNHKYCGKETAPTNQLGHSSSLQSVNHGAHVKCNFQEIDEKKYETKNMFKSQHNTKLEKREPDQKGIQKGVSPNKVYFHHNVKNSFSSEPHIFRSHAANDLNSPKSPKYHNYSFNSPVHARFQEENNYSLDEHNMIGPYRKDRVYSNLRKEKIALVDSMVMVREQSEEVEEDWANLSRGKYLMEESIIIMGKEGDDRVLEGVYQ